MVAQGLSVRAWLRPPWHFCAITKNACGDGPSSGNATSATAEVTATYSARGDGCGGRKISPAAVTAAGER